MRRFRSAAWLLAFPLAVVLAGLAGRGAAASKGPSAQFVWLEGESPTKQNVEAKASGWGNAHYLSGQKWLHLSLTPQEVQQKLPAPGALFDYDFSLAKAGKHEVWARIGFEFVRAPFDWRIDDGPWAAVKPTDLTTDLMEIDFWCEVAWLKLGDVDLSAGKHTLHIRIPAPFKEEKVKEKDKDGKDVEVVQKKPDRIIYALDCVCIHEGAFRPNGRFQPGQPWQTEQDRKADRQVFQVKPEATPGERITTPLGGQWQVCRYDESRRAGIEDRTGPIRTLPDADEAYWLAIEVPGDKYKVRPELAFCHRFFYRTRVQVPAELKGRSFFLRFPSVNMIATVFVNGQPCGWTKAMLTNWDCDITQAVKPGEVNEIWVGIKDTYYARSPKKSGQDCRTGFNVPVSILTRNYVTQHYDFPVASTPQAGILEEPSLVVAGGVYAADVFAIPSVQKKELGLEIALANPTAGEQTVRVENEIVPLEGTAAEKRFAAKDVKLAPGGEQVIKLAERWASPKLWWPDSPSQYQVVTKVRVGGKVVDIARTKFGFREWTWDGPQFKLNGVPWPMWADCTGNDGRAGAEATVAQWRRQGQNMYRFWGDHFAGMNYQQTLDFMDAQGIPVRRSGIFDGQGANYLHGLVSTETLDGQQVTVAHKELFDNWIGQLRAQVKAERNHPSIFIWSIENEITFINSRNLGLHRWVEPEIARGARAAMEADPTRPAMVDGGRCLVDQSLPVNGCHYTETAWRDYPDEAYTLERIYVSHEQPVQPNWGKCIWQLVKGRPIFLGESYFLRGYRPASFAQFGGESCFTGWAYTKRGAGLFAKMLAEGYRWHGVAAQHFWLGSEDASLHYNSWQGVCVLCRQWNWTFGAGTQVKRTLKVFNDTHYAEPIEMAWELKLDGKHVAGEKKTYRLGPGLAEEAEISFQVPAVTKRTGGEFILTCSRGGKEVFREVKEVWVIDPAAGPKPALAPEELAVIDPFGSVRDRLKARGIGFTQAAKADDIPPTAKVVVIGKDALTARDATDPKWLSLAARGLRLLVLDQAHPLHYLAVPADLEPTDFVGRVAFAEDLTHPAFGGLDQPDFFTWSKDHVVYRNVYKKASRGAKSLAHCDEELGYSALAECPANDGLMLLCQLVVGEKLAYDPVAQGLFDNLLAYCATYQPVRKSTAVVLDAQTPRGKLLAESGLIYDTFPAADALGAIQGGKHEIVVLDADKDNLSALVGKRDAVKAFADKGGWLVLWGLTPEGLASFNHLVGVDHLLRPFERERVTLPPVRDPILSGLTMRDVVMQSGETIMFGDRFLASDVFTHVVDFDDIAPFCTFPPPKHFCPFREEPGPDNWPRNMVNGFVSADSWKYIFSMYPKQGATQFDLKLPRSETIVQFDITPNAFYNIISKVKLTYDGDPASTVTLNLKPDGGPQSVELKPRKCKVLHVDFCGWNQRSTQDVIGVDNLSVKVARTDDFQRKVKPLLNLGALVKYPRGKGGILLCQLNIPARESVAENAQKKKNIITVLLRNLGARFAGGKLLVAGEGLRYEPVALGERCNQFLTSDRGWFDGGRDLRHFPVGASKLAGVEYAVRDFKTSPLPCCVMLGGPGVKGNLPREVKGLAVNRKADALFFLHAFRQTRTWNPPRQGPQAPPPLFQYVVHYADGKAVDVPVLYGQGADHWIQKTPAGLKDAAVAWVAPFPGDNSGEQACVYQFQWSNPRPDIEIKAVDLMYDSKTGGSYGVPVLLALTAATAIK